ncbi:MULTISPECIES: hypothetical protein [unclassified Ensifer]|uniref:hypothetical protein n=1 Tax=unclassified Ensifer TaxID=2633371 RepID=UPI0008135992|nr:MULTISPECIES: hypothetical protein [unclassified Ensifer]OCP21960.1 hypothetical protein BC361_25665 [Ensifer sp. LC54]OCP23260.1 hypothetical protein BC363_25100 [Ensifer sp. LC384]
MFQEAVLETRECDRYFGFLVETQEYELPRSLDDQWDEICVGREFLWRVTDRITGVSIEGPIMDAPYEDILQAFEETWETYAQSKPVAAPPNPYADHPNYGRF